MLNHHARGCACAYCDPNSDPDPEASARAASRRALAAFAIFFLLGAVMGVAVARIF